MTVEGTGHLSSNVVIDWPLLEKYVQSIKAIQSKFKLEDSFSLRDLLLREDLISIEEGHEGNPELEQLVLDAIENAAVQLKQMRIVEGKVLEDDIHNQLNILSEKTTLLKNMHRRLFSFIEKDCIKGWRSSPMVSSMRIEW